LQAFFGVLQAIEHLLSCDLSNRSIGFQTLFFAPASSPFRLIAHWTRVRDAEVVKNR
jgi:hypothetical protein